MGVVESEPKKKKVTIQIVLKVQKQGFQMGCLCLSVLSKGHLHFVTVASMQEQYLLKDNNFYRGVHAFF